MGVEAAEEQSDRIVVPVRHVGDGIDVVVTGRMPDGSRTGIAFTTPALLLAAMGDAAFDHLTLTRLHQLLDPIGIERVQVDPDRVMTRVCGPVPRGA